MSMKTIVDRISLIILGAILGWMGTDTYFDHLMGKPSLLDDFVSTPVSQNIQPEQDKSNISPAQINSDVENLIDTNKKLDAFEDHVQTSAWLKERGYFSYEDFKAFETYDDNTLIELGKSGDKLALNVLYTRYIERNERDKAIPLIKEAIARGSSSALADLAIFTLPSYSNEDNLDSRKNAVIETFAVYRVAEMMGDLQVSAVGLKTEKASLEKRYGNLNLTDEDYDLINKRAKELFSEFREERLNLGLGEFDTSTPKMFSEKYSSSK